MSDLVGRHLVDGNAGVNVRTGGLLDPDTGQERAAGPRVVAGAVWSGRGVDMVQSGEDLQAVFDVLQRLQSATQFKVFAFPLRPPVRRDGSVGEVDEGHPQRRAGRRRRHLTGTGRKCGKCAEGLEGWQRQTCAEATQEAAPAETGVSLSGEVIAE